MKNKIYKILLFVMPVFMLACEEDEGVFTGPSDLFITGPASVAPGDEEKYSLGDIENPDSYTWSVDGPAEIVGETSGDTITISYQAVGDVVISVTNGAEDEGILNVEVNEVEPAVTATFNPLSTGVLGSGDKDTVFFEFAAPLVNDPEIVLNTDTSGFIPNTDAFVSGSLGELQKVSDTKYYVIYTAGAGNGTPEVLLSGLEATEAFGGLKFDSLGYAYVQLYEVDNVDPVADLTYSDAWVNDSTVVTITATFSEPITSTDYVTDSVILISLSGAGVEAETDTLQPTDDPLVYTYEYTVNGEGNGTVMVELEDIIDLAGNPLASVTNDAALQVDNTDPGLVAGVANDSGGGNGTYASIEITSTESGTGMYLILEDGETGPTTVEEFMEASGVASGTLPLNAGVSSSAIEPLSTGNYNVYYLVMDGAGNYSSIGSSDLTMD